MSQSLNILYVCSELSPLASTGGLGDVTAALPPALRAFGHDVRVAIPCYEMLPSAVCGEVACECKGALDHKTVEGVLRRSVMPGTDIPLYLVEYEPYFGREHLYGAGGEVYDDNLERFCFFCAALLDAMPKMNWKPDLVHCHDWHTAAIPVHLVTRLRKHPYWSDAATVLTIHNMAYQGQFPAADLLLTGLGPDTFTTKCLEYFGDINMLKGGIACANKLSTVSPRYAQEIQTGEYGAGLDGFLRRRARDLTGILNGVDKTVWNPATDPHIAATYSAEQLDGKACCKSALQDHFNLTQNRVPLIGMVTRLDWQKGTDLVLDALPAMMRIDTQLAILGTGDRSMAQRLSAAATRYPHQLGVALRYDVALSHRIEAGSDFFLMPSRFEPCGLSQMYSLAYGAVPIVRRTGGLADSVKSISESRADDGATGIVFDDATPEAIVHALKDAVALYRNCDRYRAVQQRGMREDFSWQRAARAYEKLYRQALAP